MLRSMDGSEIAEPQTTSKVDKKFELPLATGSDDTQVLQSPSNTFGGLVGDLEDEESAIKTEDDEVVNSGGTQKVPIIQMKPVATSGVQQQTFSAKK